MGKELEKRTDTCIFITESPGVYLNLSGRGWSIMLQWKIKVKKFLKSMIHDPVTLAEVGIWREVQNLKPPWQHSHYSKLSVWFSFMVEFEKTHSIRHQLDLPGAKNHSPPCQKSSELRPLLMHRKLQGSLKLPTCISWRVGGKEI